MTAFFVKKFKSVNACALCKKDKISGYSLCPKHLEKARLQFENWANERRRCRRCISCDRRPLPKSTEATVQGRFQLRCWFHARINLDRIRKWMAAHPNYSHQSWLKHKERYQACRDAGHERKRGHRVCDACSHRSGYGAAQTA